MLDFYKTVEAYAGELGYTVTEGESIMDESIQDFLVYRCMSCNKIHKLTFEEAELRYRRAAAAMALKYRRQAAFKRNAKYMDLDSGLEICGLCSGVDESREGHCLKSLMAVCFIRKSHLAKNK